MNHENNEMKSGTVETSTERQVEQSQTDVKADAFAFTEKVVEELKRTVIRSVFTMEFLARLGKTIMDSKAFNALLRTLIKDTVHEILNEERKRREGSHPTHVDLSKTTVISDQGAVVENDTGVEVTVTKETKDGSES